MVPKQKKEKRNVPERKEQSQKEEGEDPRGKKDKEQEDDPADQGERCIWMNAG